MSRLRKLQIIKSDDYLSWLQSFDKFSLVPLYIKQSGQYGTYIAELAEALRDFFRRTRPLDDYE